MEKPEREQRNPSRKAAGGMTRESQRIKVYVKVNADHNSDGTCSPKTITFEDGEKYEIDRVCSCCRAASTRAGGIGIRYTIRVRGTETYLFDEENGKWFVEGKKEACIR